MARGPHSGSVRRPASSGQSVPAAPRGRLDRSVLWSGGLLLASFPLMLLFLVLVHMLATLLGIELGDPEHASQERWLNLGYLAMVLAVLGTSIVIGLRGWRRRGERLALAAAILSALTVVGFLLLPAVA